MEQRDRSDAEEDGLKSNTFTSISEEQLAENSQERQQHSSGATREPGTCSTSHQLPDVAENKITVRKDIKLEHQALLEKLDLWRFHSHKLSLKNVLQISKTNINREQPETLRDIAMQFLRNIVRANYEARTTEFGSRMTLEENVQIPEDKFSFLKKEIVAKKPESNSISILDLIVAVFLCSDQCLQQAIMAKMSLCQFALPLLLPDSSTGSLTFLLWAIRSVTHLWRPHSMEDGKGYVEDYMATTPMPMISFMRMGDCQVSKSEVVNSFLSSDKHDFFVHRNMNCGDFPRKISNGLVEICFSLPRGNTISDIFPDIVAVLNLRGDVRDNQTQFKFLKEISAALFIFVEKVGESECTLFTSNFDSNEKPFLIINKERSAQEETNLETICERLDLEENNVLLGKFSKKIKFQDQLKKFVVDAVQKKKSANKSLQEAIGAAKKLGIDIDESEEDLKKVNESVQSIMNDVKPGIEAFKEKMLPCQGKVWNKWATLDKEQWRLRNRGAMDMRQYCEKIEMEKRGLREKQSEQGLSQTMKLFFQEFTTSSKNLKLQFLQSMKIELESVSRQEQARWIEARKSLQTRHANVNKECEHLTKGGFSSLGVEHFMREMAQIYEASKVSVTHRTKYEVLPSVMVEMLLEGLPMELMDGDAGCIPTGWVTDVLKEVQSRLGSDVRVLVLSVLGVQSSGKSTLLNIMFGLQCTVGRYNKTHGVVMHLIRIDDELKKQLQFDVVLVIDSEGLKAPELAPSDTNHEHDNELATLVIGLSDVVMINLKMENAEEVTDILQIVVHALIRMTDTGKKPSCMFVHQGSGDLSAHDKNTEARDSILQLLDRSTADTAKMENKYVHYKRFNDVIDYDVLQDNWYLPELWTSGLLVKPLSSEYSNKVLDLKKKIFEKCKATTNIYTLSEFSSLLNTIWTSIKKENFIFSFKNLRVFHAYNKLCSQYSEWELELRSSVQSWLEDAENRILNVQLKELDKLCADLEGKLENEVSKNKLKCNTLLQIIFDNSSEDAHLLLKYKRDFFASYDTFSEKTYFDALKKYEKIVSKRRSHAVVLNKFKYKIAECVRSLLEKNKSNPQQVEKNMIQSDFDQVWSESFSLLGNGTIQDDIENIFYNGEEKEKVKERLCGQPLCDLGKKRFVVKDKEHKLFPNEPHSSQISISSVADNVITDCTAFIEGIAETRTNYCSVQWGELLSHINSLFQTTYPECNDKLKVDLKLYVCSVAIEAFVKQYKQFLKQQLSDMKSTALNSLKYICQNGDEKQNISNAFCKCFIKPAIVGSIHQKLGKKVVTKIKKDRQIFSSQKHLQMAILLHLLMEEDFDTYVNFISSYENARKDWVKMYVVKVCKGNDFGNSHNICIMKRDVLSDVKLKIKTSIITAKAAQTPSATVADFFRRVNYALDKDVVLEHAELLNVFHSFHIHDADGLEQFSDAVIAQLELVVHEMQPKCSDACNVEKLLDDLRVKPYMELLDTLRGCGEHCPHCGAPCDQGGTDHRQHAATIHYPQGILGTKNSDDTFMTDVCTTSMAKSENLSMFTSPCSNAGGYHVESRNYRRVNTCHGNWNIPSEPEQDNPLFWKFVLHRFNKRFAQHYGADKAEIPPEWESVTRESVEVDLNERYFGTS